MQQARTCLLILTSVFSAAGSIVGSSARAATPAANASPVNVGTSKQLFIDDHVVRATDGVFRTLNRPTKYKNNPVLELKPAQQVGGQQLIIAQGSVIYDAEDKLFKMWYEGATYHWRNNVVAYAYSKDGVNWTLPNLGLVKYQGSKNNNIVLHTGAGEMAPGAFKDTHDKDPSRRYKMLYFSRGNSSPVAVGFSPDGIHWKTTTKGKLIPIGDSLHPVLWNPKLKKYIAHSRHNRRTSAGFEERQVLQSESDDFLNWTRYGVIMKPDEHDPPGHRQFYDMSWMMYEGVYVGFMSVYHLTPSEQFKTPQQSWEDRVDVQLAFSRDDRHWTHAGNRQTFIGNSKRPGDYDHGVIYTMHRPMVVGDEIWIYYVGYSGLHWATRRKEIQGGGRVPGQAEIGRLCFDRHRNAGDADHQAPGDVGGSPGGQRRRRTRFASRGVDRQRRQATPRIRRGRRTPDQKRQSAAHGPLAAWSGRESSQGQAHFPSLPPGAVQAVFVPIHLELTVEVRRDPGSRPRAQGMGVTATINPVPLT
jgi:hypothetical protein